MATHVYDYFDTERAGSAARAAETFLASIDAALARFRAAVDPG